MPCIAHARLQRMLSKFVRVYFYDRSGYDQSERGPEKTITAQSTARDLASLMFEGINVHPPYVLVGHSYGCILAREFLNQHPKAIVGMVLAEAATELFYEVFPQIPTPALQNIATGIDFAKLTHLHEDSRMTEEEWEAALEAIERSLPAADAEDNRGSGRTLVTYQQFRNQALSSWPLSVLRCNMAQDYRILYEEGVRRGNGTEAERLEAQAFIQKLELFDDELRASQLRLSAINRYVYVPSCGHDVVIRRPELLISEVDWVIRQLK